MSPLATNGPRRSLQCVTDGCHHGVLFQGTDGKCMSCYSQDKTPWRTHLTGVSRRRRASGEMTEEKVREIRRIKKGDSQIRTRMLAQMFNCSHSTISDILRGATWSHVKDTA